MLWPRVISSVHENSRDPSQAVGGYNEDDRVVERGLEHTPHRMTDQKIAGTWFLARPYDVRLLLVEHPGAARFCEGQHSS